VCTEVRVQFWLVILKPLHARFRKTCTCE